MFPLEFSQTGNANIAANAEEDCILWHSRFGYLNFQCLQDLKQNGMVIGLPNIKQFNGCEACNYGKLARTSFPHGRSWRAKERLHLVHADLCGPMHVEYLGGRRYFLLFVDDFSRMS